MDKLAELEKVILDYYLEKGYKVGKGLWSFKVDIVSNWKSKLIEIVFKDNNIRTTVYMEVFENTEEMWSKAIKHFKNIEVR